jgi:thioredoxin 1
MTEIVYQQLEDLKNTGEKILVEFGADWCTACKTLKPKLVELSGEYENITFVYLNVDKYENMDKVVELGIKSLPTVVIYNGNEEVEWLKGPQTNKTYTDILNKL